MKSDNNIEKVWSREGTLHYVKAGGDNRVYKINSLYDGGQALGYDFYTVQSCFKDTRVFIRKSLDPNLFLPPSAIIPTTMSILTVKVRSLKNILMIWKHLFIVLSLHQM